jgi:hypothetical protein
MPRLDTDHRQARLGQRAEKPLRQWPSFQSNPLEVVDGVDSPGRAQLPGQDVAREVVEHGGKVEPARVQLFIFAPLLEPLGNRVSRLSISGQPFILEELIYRLVATLIAAPHSVGGKIHTTRHRRVVCFNDPNVFERPKANNPSEGFPASYRTVLR